MDTYVYRLGRGLYINLTNDCNNDCAFCERQSRPGVAGYRLWLEQEPDAQQVLEALRAGMDEAVDEVVFCGYGEPTLRLDVLKEVAAYVKSYGGKVRVNTNGLANREYGRDVVPELENLVDVMSISLNEASAEKYDAVCHSIYGPAAFDEMLDFARRCAGTRMDTVLSVVDVISPEDIAVCREIAEKVGARLRVREYSAE